MAYTPEVAVMARRMGFVDCPACGELTGGVHRKGVRLWEGRRDRALANDGTDPVSGVSLGDAQRHLAYLAA